MFCSFCCYTCTHGIPSNQIFFSAALIMLSFCPSLSFVLSFSHILHDYKPQGAVVFAFIMSNENIHLLCDSMNHETHFAC